VAVAKATARIPATIVMPNTTRHCSFVSGSTIRWVTRILGMVARKGAASPLPVDFSSEKAI